MKSRSWTVDDNVRPLIISMHIYIKKLEKRKCLSLKVSIVFECFHDSFNNKIALKLMSDITDVALALTQK
jgi:hypothetical protein